MAELLPIPEASRRLGVSITSIRRGLKAGRLRGERRATPQGHLWLVEVPDQAEPPDAPGIAAATPSTTRDYPVDSPAVPADYPAVKEAVARLEAHNADLRERVNDQAREISELHRLLANQQQLLLMSPKVEPQTVEAMSTNGHAHTQSAAPEWPEQRRWWQRLVWG